MTHLKNRVAIVTGANRGVGKAIVDALLECGAKKVYATARNAAGLNHFTDNRVTPVTLDIINSQHIANLKQQAGNDDGTRKYLGIYTCDKYNTSQPAGEGLEVTGVKKIYLKVDFNGANLQFYYGTEKDQWQPIGPLLDGSILSDDYVENAQERFRACFTGAFVGLCCQDLSGRNLHADFEWFEYKELA